MVCPSIGGGLTSQSYVIYMVFSGVAVDKGRAKPTKPCNLHGFAGCVVDGSRSNCPKVSLVFLKGLQATVAKPCKLRGVSQLARTC